jgi:hypothetical protein
MVEQMPESQVREILDFAEFLLTKEVRDSSRLNTSPLSLSEKETTHLEQEFFDYKRLYPKQLDE